MSYLKRAAVPFLLALAAVAAGASDQFIFDDKADANAQIRAAVTEASKQGKNVLLDFGANWCFDCHVLENVMRLPDIAPMVEKNYVVVHIDVGRFDKNLSLAKKFHIPIEKGVPALAVLDSEGNLLYAQKQGEFERARSLRLETFRQFFEKWAPKKN
ncbi:MAG: thioredoxin family protein [Deltaproteobacteria bacterium]